MHQYTTKLGQIVDELSNSSVHKAQGRKPAGGDEDIQKNKHVSWQCLEMWRGSSKRIEFSSLHGIFFFIQTPDHSVEDCAFYPRLPNPACRLLVLASFAAKSFADRRQFFGQSVAMRLRLVFAVFEVQSDEVRVMRDDESTWKTAR